jgi:hypothetical protein
MAVSFKYGAEALAMVGIAYGLIKWVGRNVRSLVSDSRVEEAHVEALAASMARHRFGRGSRPHDTSRARVPRGGGRTSGRRLG